VSSREEAIVRHAEWLLNADEAEGLRAALYELEGLDLLCYCAPLPCHADLLLYLANSWT
jgi:hypothetical protein